MGGVSQGAHFSLNLGLNSGDDRVCVQRNRTRVVDSAALPAEPMWLAQVHGTKVVGLEHAGSEVAEADGSFTKKTGVVCGVLTADCLPVLLCDSKGTQVAALHAGWRGLAAGIVQQGVQMFEQPSEVVAWLGPAISQRAFEVGGDVVDAFIGKNAELGHHFLPSGTGRWMADLHGIAAQLLASMSVTVSNPDPQYCTYGDRADFFSYRRDGETGRMLSAIWIINEKN